VTKNLEYKNKLKVIAELLAYYSFTNRGYEILSSRNFTHEDIVKFAVLIFFPTYQNSQGVDVVDPTIRFTVYLGTAAQYQEITFLFDEKLIVNAIVEKYYEKSLGVFQQYLFEFSRPNTIQLFDAQFALTELLGIDYD